MLQRESQIQFSFKLYKVISFLQFCKNYYSYVFGQRFVMFVIFSRTGSKLGISPLMLAAMNGHTAAVKLLLDMGSDINAQIETNRNTALTLACFQGRHEVVSLLVDRKANIEHRAKVSTLHAHNMCSKLVKNNYSFPSIF